MKARLVEGYHPDFDLDLRAGRAGERFVLNFIDGLTANGTVEVKTDRLAHQTGNLWIEYQCRRRDGWQDSGIRITTADYWALVIGETVVIHIPTRILRAIFERAYADKGLHSEEKDGSHPTRGVKIPLFGLFWTWLRMELIRDAKAKVA